MRRVGGRQTQAGTVKGRSTRTVTVAARAESRCAGSPKVEPQEDPRQRQGRSRTRPGTDGTEEAWLHERQLSTWHREFPSRRSQPRRDRYQRSGQSPHDTKIRRLRTSTLGECGEQAIQEQGGYQHVVVEDGVVGVVGAAELSTGLLELRGLGYENSSRSRILRGSV